MNVSPLAARTDLASMTVKLNGRALPDDYVLESVKVSREVNRLGSAQIVLSDGDPSRENFDVSQSRLMAPGQPVEVLMGYHQHNRTVFKGIIVKHGVRVRESGRSELALTCADSAVKLTTGRKSAVYRGQTETEVWQQLLKAHGLALEESAAQEAEEAAAEAEEAEEAELGEGTPPPDLVRYYSSDWDFMLTRADANGQVVLVDDTRLTIAEPSLSGNSCGLRVTYGESIIAFNGEMDARNQLSSVHADGWDIADQKALSEESEEEAPGEGPAGYISGKALSRVMNGEAFDLMSAAPLGSAELQAWANAQLRKSRLARVCGTVSFQGSALAAPGKTIELAGLGGRFNGDVYIARVEHTQTRGQWVTEVGFGMSPRWFAAGKPDAGAMAASGLLPAAQGLQIGTVLQIEADPIGQLRVLVDLPLIDRHRKGVWARLGTPYATGQGGIFFMPERGDEVAVGFFHNDPRFPVVVASLFSSKHQFTKQPDLPNTYKGIVTKGGLTVMLEDVKKVVTISTPGGHSVVMDDEKKSIKVTDTTGNTVTLSEEGMSLDSKGKLTITAAGDIEITAGAALTMRGASSAALRSDGVVTVQGSEVRVN